MKLITAFLAFFLLSARAGPHDDEFCTEFLGKGLKFTDCFEAYKLVPATVANDLPGPASTRAKLFSNEPDTNPRFRLPQTFTSGQCVIEVSMAANVDYGASLWDIQRMSAKRIMDYCVQPHGIGGRVMLDATTIEIRSTTKRKSKQTAVQDSCLALPVESAAFKCILDANNAALEANTALDDFTDQLSRLTYKLNTLDARLGSI